MACSQTITICDSHLQSTSDLMLLYCKYHSEWPLTPSLSNNIILHKMAWYFKSLITFWASSDFDYKIRRPRKPHPVDEGVTHYQKATQSLWVITEVLFKMYYLSKIKGDVAQTTWEQSVHKDTHACVGFFFVCFCVSWFWLFSVNWLSFCVIKCALFLIKFESMCMHRFDCHTKRDIMLSIMV